MHCPHIALWKKIAVASTIVLIIIAITLIAIYYPFTSAEVEKIQEPKGSVVTNGIGCAQIGSSILEKNGSAVDATIAALFCEGVSMPQSMGLGGGFLMTIYDHEKGVVESLNAREIAPGKATQDMFHGNSTLSTKGGLSVAVPGELRGYWYAYQRYGKLPWAELVQPTIDLCRSGVPVTKFLAKIFAGKLDLLTKDPSLRSVFIDPKTKKTYLEGEKIKMLKYAETLEIIAKEGGDALNNGTLTEMFAKDIQDLDGIITPEDLRNYEPEWQPSINITLPNNQILYTAPLPGSGVILSFILNLLQNYLNNDEPIGLVNWQKIVESFKFGYGKRTELGDLDTDEMKKLIKDLTSLDYAINTRKQIHLDQTSQDPTYYGAKFDPVEDHGTAHVSVLAPNGDAVAVTSTINFVFGAAFASPSTGIILNDEMDDFSSPDMNNGFGLPPSPSNYIVPGKRPLSSMCPTIIVDRNEKAVRLVTGGAGGSKITTSVALIIIKHLWFGVDIKTALAEKRLHHQLFPMWIEFEESFENDMFLVDGLSKIGHNYTFAATDGFSALTAISKINGTIKSSFDTRRPGDISYIY